MKVYGVILVYYKEYYFDAISRFKKILDRIDRNNELIIVSNNTEIRGDILGHGYNAIEGNNSFWEFSGWSCGVESLSKSAGLNDVFVFANDTFIKHRYFGFVDELLFASATKSINLLNRPALIGELCEPIGEFSINGFSQTGWISTYLFAMNYEMLSRLDRWHYARDIFEKIIVDIDSERILFNRENVSGNFSVYMNNWLYPKKEGGWYASNKSVDVKRLKLMAILNEKRISSICQNNNGELINIYHGIWKLYFRFKNSFYYRVKKIMSHSE